MRQREGDSVPILIVEDSPTVAKLTEYWLIQGLPHPLDLHHATSVSSTLEILGRVKFQAIILDLNLPDSQGLETFLQIQAAVPQIPIVILSAEADEEVAVEAVSRGAQDYVVKSNGNTNVLARPVRYALERSRRQHAESELKESERQMFVAASIQQQLLPTSAPKCGMDIVGRCQPADITGGDFFDYICFPDGTLGIVIGDVSGHGLPAALMMIETRAVLRALTRTFSDAAEILFHANAVISPDLRDRFVSVFLAIFAADGRSYHYASAGHPSFIVKSSGETEMLAATTTPLGITLPPADVAPSVHHGFHEGDALVLFTDGLTESFSRAVEMFGHARLSETLRKHVHRSATEIVDLTFEAVSTFTDNSNIVDDNTMVVIKYSGGGSHDV